MKKQVERMLTGLEKAVKKCKKRGAKAPNDNIKYLYEGGELAYTAVIKVVRREFKNLLQPDVTKSVCFTCNVNKREKGERYCKSCLEAINQYLNYENKN